MILLGRRTNIHGSTLSQTHIDFETAWSVLRYHKTTQPSNSNPPPHSFILPTPTQRNPQKVKLANKPVPTVRIMRNIAPTNSPVLQRTMLNRAARNRPLQRIRARLDGEVRQRDLQAVACSQVRQAEVAGADVFGGDLQFVVAAVVAFLPLQLFVVADQEGGLVVGFDEGGVGAERGVGGDGWE